MSSRAIFTLSVATLLSSPLLTRAQTATTATTTGSASTAGTAIGTAISTAISTAFPVIGTILNAIWPPGQETKNKQKPAATAATTSLKQQSNQGLQSLAAVSAELDTITTFLASCVVAEDNVASLRGFLQGKTTPLSADDKLQVQRYWNPAKDNIASLKSAAASINGLGDPSIQTVFRSVANANSGLLDNINAELNSSAGSAMSSLAQDLTTLNNQLAAVNALSGEIIGDISIGIKAAKNTAAGAAGSTPLTDAQKAARATFNSVLSKAYPSIQQ
jgi:hypothetical protein